MRTLTIAVLLLSAACEKKAALPEAKAPVALTKGEAKAAPSTATNPVAQLPAGVDASVETNGLRVSDAIARACGVPKQDTRASFDFDSAAIGEDDKQLLAAVARCLTEGALQGKSVSLVGRADPRGEDEYNMSLGGTRAEAVRKYLHDLGVQKEHLGATSRGEIDAAGTDEAGWARDRRVDIELVN
jgi:peptidoglycan-associated lipoprotein